MNLVLCGMMGCGKTTVGGILATLLNRRFVDTDEEIVKAHGAISELFERFGEPYFRALETETVRSLDCDGLVIATGGGVVLKEENRRLLQEHGKIFYLHTSCENLIRRVEGDHSRPLLRGGDVERKVRELTKQRDSVYRAAADYIIETDGKTAEEVAKAIVAVWEKV